jgi:hypothetical protein
MLRAQNGASLTSAWELAVAALALLLCGAAASAQELIDCPPRPATGVGIPQPTISHQMFNEVCFLNPDPVGPIPAPILFDDFAWRSFLAMAWPAKQGQRGVPDAAARLDAAQRPAVFETLKSEWEVFQGGGQAPQAWNDYGGATPCDIPARLGFGDMVLAAFSKFDSILQSTGRSFSGPLVSQNGRYVRYSTGFNQPLFQHMVDGRYYLADGLNNFTPFAAGSVRVKASWIEMDGVTRPERFHVRQSWIFNRQTQRCEQKLVGLVGLHIVTKTPSLPQWVWATFEHVDNVPGPHSTGPFTFNKGDHQPMGSTNPIACNATTPCPATPPAPYNVERPNPILGEPPADANFAFSTSETNAKYRALLAQQFPSAPWRNYQLVMAQWPLHPNRPDLDGSIADTFPGDPGISGVPVTATANATIETFLQTSPATGCMSCHLHAKRYDYVSSLLTRPFAPAAAALPAGHADALNKVKAIFDTQFQR